jgi:PAS domain S-box-containing protein
MEAGGDRTMLTQDIDFHEIFRISPTGMALLTADLFFVDVNDQFLAEAGRQLEELIGHNFFEIFPKMPVDLGQTERMVLEQAFDTGRRAQVTLGRYDVEDPACPGTFIKHYWSSVVQPIRGPDGRVEVYELSVRNVTPVIAEYLERWAWRESPEEPEALAEPVQSQGAAPANPAPTARA